MNRSRIKTAMAGGACAAVIAAAAAYFATNATQAQPSATAPTTATAPSTAPARTPSTSAATTTRVAAPAPASTPAPATRTTRRPPASLEDFSARYALLAEKNIFIRNRPITRIGGSRETSSATVRRPEESLILTGITLQEGRHVAFIENSLTRSTQRLVPGDSISGLSGTKVLTVAFDTFEFESNGKPVKIDIGRNLLNSTYVAPTASATPSPTTPTAASPASATGAPSAPTPAGAAPTASSPAAASALPGDATMSIEERLKLRRAQQTKQ